MKKFLNYLAVLLVFAIAAAFALDGLYTYVYKHAKPRNKFQYVMAMRPRHYDDVFLGSSRTANHIDAKRFAQATGKSAINLGIEGAALEDNLLELKILLSKKVSVSRVYLQVDYLFEKSGSSFIANSAALPFLREPVVAEHLKPFLTDYDAAYYLPFYRYMTSDFAIGFREVSLLSTGKSGKIDLADGFVPKDGKGSLGKFALPEKISKRNVTIEKFRRICADNKIELVLFIAPVCSGTENLDYVQKLKMRLPDLRDYSRVFPDSLFFNCNHLSRNGAEKFTDMLAADLIRRRN